MASRPPPPKPQDISRYCLGCGYPLVGLDKSRCPECGLAFNPGDPWSWSDSGDDDRPCSFLRRLGAMAIARWTAIALFGAAWLSGALVLHLVEFGGCFMLPAYPVWMAVVAITGTQIFHRDEAGGLGYWMRLCLMVALPLTALDVTLLALEGYGGVALGAVAGAGLAGGVVAAMVRFNRDG